jgi:hypothetical protein
MLRRYTTSTLEGLDPHRIADEPTARHHRTSKARRPKGAARNSRGPRREEPRPLRRRRAAVRGESRVHATQPPAYDQVVEMYEIDILRRPADWSPDGGDLATTDDGDIKVGDDIYSAMVRLVERWRLESPTLEALFDATVVSKARNDRYAKRIDQLGPLAVKDWAGFARDFRSANEEGGAHELGRSIYAGAIILVLANLLSRFLKDMRFSENSAEKIAPLFDGFSFFAIVRAAANNFRHHDEWARTRRNSARQKQSISILAAVLREHLANPEIEARGRNVCAEVLEVVSSSSYEGLNQNLFHFAKSAVETASSWRGGPNSLRANSSS